MKHLYGRPRNSLWRIINTWAFAVHYHAALCGRSIPFRSRGPAERPEGTKSPGLSRSVRRRDFCRSVRALSRSEDELSPIQRLLRLRFGSFANNSFDACTSSFPRGNPYISVGGYPVCASARSVLFARFRAG